MVTVTTWSNWYLILHCQNQKLAACYKSTQSVPVSQLIGPFAFAGSV